MNFESIKYSFVEVAEFAIFILAQANLNHTCISQFGCLDFRYYYIDHSSNMQFPPMEYQTTSGCYSHGC